MDGQGSDVIAVPTFVPTWIKLQLKGQHVLGRLGQRLNWVNGNLFYTECADRTSKVEVYMISTTTWDCMKIVPTSSTGGVPPQPGYRFLYTCTTCGDELVLVGGTDSRKSRLSEIWFFNTISKEWRLFPREGNQMPGRESHSATLLDNKLYIFGGNGNIDLSRNKGAAEDTKYLNDLWCLDLATETLAQLSGGDDGPPARTNHAAATTGSWIIVCGGDCGDKYLDDIWSYNTTTRTWTQLSIASAWHPGPRAAHTAIGIGDNAILVYGGVDNAAKVSEAVWILYVGPGSHHNLSEREAHWEMLQVVGMLPGGRFAHTSDYGDGCFFISGGFNNGDQRMEDLYVLTLTEPAKTSMMLGCAPDGATTSTQLSAGKPQATKRFDPGPRKVTSYNVYCTEVRDSLRSQHPDASARDIEKMIGQQWANMTAEQKREYEEKARNTNAHSIALHNAGMKVDDRSSSGSYKKMRVDKQSSGIHSAPAPPPETTFQLFTPNPSLIGSNVEGKIDAVFNAGYLATVKCNGFTYRALLFSPYLALSVPVSVQPTQGGSSPFAGLQP